MWTDKICTGIYKLSWWLFRWRVYQTDRLLKKVERAIVSHETKKRNERTRLQTTLSRKVDANVLENKKPVSAVPRSNAKKAR